ncbi:MAG: hypothetical protein WCG28_01445 [bacterium]
MGIFFSNNDKGKLVLVFHVGSSSVNGALFFARKDGIPKIIFSVNEPIALEENISADRLLFLTIKTLEIVASKIHKAGVGAPKEIFCVLSSLWYISQNRIIKFKKNTPFLFTSKFASDLIKKETTLFEEDHAVKYLHAGVPPRLIEIKSTKMMINGYETPTPLNQKGTDLEMTIFISMSSEQILGKIEDTIRKHFSFKEIKFSSFTFSSFAVVRDIYTHNEDFLLTDIDGEVTDICMIKKNMLRELISFPLGVNFMIRDIASEFRYSLSEAKSIISLLKDGHATVSVSKGLVPIMKKLKMEWLSKFQESLANISNDISVPGTIYLVVDKEMSGFFSDIIKTEQFSQYTLTDSQFKVTFLDAEVFHGMVSFEDNVNRDPFLIINSIYINRFLINNVHPNKQVELKQV